MLCVAPFLCQCRQTDAVKFGYLAFLCASPARCHPDLAEVPNRLFYGSRLLMGCTPAERGPAIPGLPTLGFCHVRGAEQYDSARSAFNRSEAAVVAALLQDAIAAGLDPASCGVICFFRAQVWFERLPYMSVPQEKDKVLQA